eukprot:TRINITY_DN7869_c0_g1_i2.p1 TRINITY_DN7869_c0_g1~~TRINITY_DN7869_c0_g1_i2.p1  ORF type:complete len:385 (+),score=132.37 TRINITY_DN7869_c0_g1_i2:67-1221(+)
MIRRPPRSTLSSSSAASDVYKRQVSTQSTGEIRQIMDRAEELKTLFAAIDVNKNGKLEKQELINVFGDHHVEFLTFCDENEDGEITSEEFVAGIVADTEDLSDEDFQATWINRMRLVINESLSKAAILQCSCVTLAPYFKVKNMDEFKKIWQADYAEFKNKQSCVHYAFGFTDDGRAHCREAYTDAAACLQHLADVDTPLEAVLDPEIAELERLEVHGPAEELEKLKEALTPLGALFFTAEWGFRPEMPEMAEDTVIHLYPYFKMKEGRVSDFKAVWKAAYSGTRAAAADEKSHQYVFSFDEPNSTASCREAYGDADGVLLHLQNVGVPLGAVVAEDGPSTLQKLELHGPAAELDKLKPTFDPLGAEYFCTEWGFRNAVGGDHA